jgi:predicted Zn-dependent peptidase
MLLMNLERPLGTAESIARDLMFRGSVWTVEQQLERIAQVQCADLERAAIEMLRTTPTLSVVGKAGRFNPMKTVERSLAKAENQTSP